MSVESILQEISAKLDGIKSVSQLPKTVQVANTLNNTNYSQSFNIPVPTSVTSQNAAMQSTSISTSASPTGYLYNYVAGPYGELLYALALVCDSNTQANYTFYMTIDGVNQINNSVFTLPISLAFNPIAEGINWKLPPNSNIKIWGWYTGTSGTNGKLSVIVNSEPLEP